MNDANEIPKDLKQSSVMPFTPSLLFPQGMAKSKLDLQFRKFLEVLKKIYLIFPLSISCIKCLLMLSF